jgi:drug/metabolite transporter (DMT)-like permease
VAGDKVVDSGRGDLAVPLARYTAVALAFSFLWASAFIALKVGLRQAPPFTLMSTRFLVAGVLLFAVARARGASFPRRPGEWGAIALIGVLTNTLYLGLTAVAMRDLSAGTGAILGSTTPLLVSVASAIVLRERLTPRRLGGLVLSYAGVAWIMGTRVGEHDRPGAMALFLVCTVFLASATLLFKRATIEADLVVVNAGQCLAGGLALAVPMLVLEDVARIRWTATLLAAQAYLVFGFACGAMLLWLWLLSRGGAARASTWFFLNPVLALLLAAALLGEPLGARDLAGAAAVALGIAIAQR